MLSVKLEQSVNVKFLAKLGKSVTETYNLLTEVYGDECISRTQVFKLFKTFKEVKGEIEDDLHPGQPCSSKINANIEKVSDIVQNNRCLSIQAVAELANVDQESA
jgi:hypothetical protein